MTAAISKLKGSPCKNCLVASTCTRSFLDRTACDEYRAFLDKMLDEALAQSEKELPYNEGQTWFYNK